MELGKKIKQLRCRLGMTQEQLAERIGIGPQAVSKWENAVAMPDISTLPLLAEIFGVSIDDLFDLSAEQRLNRIESRLDWDDELPSDIFREYEEFLKEQLNGNNKQRALSLIAHLYHFQLEADARKADFYARESIMQYPDKKDCQWILQKAEGAVTWDWNIANHSKTIEFYKEVVKKGDSPSPYYYLIDNLIADHRTEEAGEYLERVKKLTGFKPVLGLTYEAAIALAEYDEQKADGIIEQALKEYPDNADMLFEAAQYYAGKCEYDKAIDYYEASFAANENRKPRFTDALNGIATIHEIRGNYRKAAETYDRIIELLKAEWGLTEESVLQEAKKEKARLMAKA
ncbi:MAG: DUF3808 domain-containing protein [Lachnospiraceae bacterium]|nr:DUF3808 domain-containing protein [Lachnospiraceae bacterium]